MKEQLKRFRAIVPGVSKPLRFFKEHGYNESENVLTVEQKTRKSLVTHYFRAQDHFNHEVKKLGPLRHIWNRNHVKV